jgi:uncharacterized membrane protein YqaE (UPF0057 family)
MWGDISEVITYILSLFLPAVQKDLELQAKFENLNINISNNIMWEDISEFIIYILSFFLPAVQKDLELQDKYQKQILLSEAESLLYSEFTDIIR